MPADIMSFTVTLRAGDDRATPEHVTQRLAAAIDLELADLEITDLNVKTQDGPAINGTELPALPDGVDLVFGVAPDTFDYGDDPITVTNVYITTREQLPYLCDNYTQTVRDYISDVFYAIGFGGAGECMESVWEVNTSNTELVRERLEQVPGFSHDAEFEAFMISCE